METTGTPARTAETIETARRTATRVGGVWLAAGSLLMIAGLGLHGPIPPELGDRMTSIAGRPLAWTVAHWIAAAGLSLLAGAGLIILTSASRLTRRGRAMTAWMVVTLGALWTVTTAVAEATAVTATALSGDAEPFATWWSFAEGHAIGVVIVCLAVAVIATDDARSPHPSPRRWPATPPPSPASPRSPAGRWGCGSACRPEVSWVAAAILVSGWTLWFGLALARRAESAWA